MPLYQYECQECATKSEHICKHDEMIYLNCHLCGGVAKRVISSGTFKINGYSEKNGYSKTLEPSMSK